MVGKLIKIKSDSNDALKKLLNDLDIAETINQKKQEVEQAVEKWTPEQWYQEIRKRWYFHPTSWYMIQSLMPEKLTPEEMSACCNGFTGCIPECRFYQPEGRISKEELQRNIQSLTEFVAWKKAPCTAVTCSMHPDHKHNQEENSNSSSNQNDEQEEGRTETKE